MFGKSGENVFRRFIFSKGKISALQTQFLMILDVIFYNTLKHLVALEFLNLCFHFWAKSPFSS